MDRLRVPLRFEREFKEKVWGGRALERSPGIALPEGVAVGETWELSDRDDVNSRVAEGPHAGRTLRELVERHGEDLLGSAPPAPGGRFPLLLKYLDANDNLSVQAHPNDEAAARIGGGAEGKTEAWYFLDVAPGGLVYAGLKPGVTPEGLAAVADGPGVVETMHRWEVSAGQCMLIPGGTMHAIGAGVALFEVQQNSDTTFRVWDWGRVGRGTHVGQALECVRFDLPPRPPVDPLWEPHGDGTARRAALARSSLFAMNALRVEGRTRFSTRGQFHVYAVVGGSGRLTVQDVEGEHRLGPGDVWLVPAAAGRHYVEPEGDELALVQLMHEA